MKPTIIKHDGHRLAVILASIIVIGILIGIVIGFNKLRDVYLDQCVIRNMSEQVSITAGKMVKADVIAMGLGLKNGVNLAEINFAEQRDKLLKRIPTLKTITIRRQLPDKVFINVEERSPIAKVNAVHARNVSGKVTDDEGMVFLCHRGTQSLPTIREPKSQMTQVGAKLKGRARSALFLIETCRDPEFQELNILEIDISKEDFLVMTLNDYSKVQIAWEGMDEENPSVDAKKALSRQLRHLISAIRSKVATTTVIWNATMPDTIFADTQKAP